MKLVVTWTEEVTTTYVSTIEIDDAEFTDWLGGEEPSGRMAKEFLEANFDELWKEQVDEERNILDEHDEREIESVVIP